MKAVNLPQIGSSAQGDWYDDWLLGLAAKSTCVQLNWAIQLCSPCKPLAVSKPEPERLAAALAVCPQLYLQVLGALHVSLTVAHGGSLGCARPPALLPPGLLRSPSPDVAGLFVKAVNMPQIGNLGMKSVLGDSV